MSIIFDIGANIGSTALFFANLNPQAKIIAFEPHPTMHNKALENIKLNNFKNIELLNKGLGAQKGVLKLYEVNKNNPGMNRILSKETDLPFKLIDIETIDDICVEQSIADINFIKIDVEGFEYFVLQGGKQIISSKKPTLFIELDDANLKANGKSAKELVELLLSFGYTTLTRADNTTPISSTTNFSDCHYDIIAK